MGRHWSWILNLLYAAVLLAAAPLLIWSAIRRGKYREGFAAKFLGRVPRRSGDRFCVWLHAVSVGEVNLLGALKAELARRRPDWEFVVSTTTKSGFDLARRKYADCTVFYCPLDFSWAVRRAMRRVRPALLVLAELELWPNLVSAARREGAKVAVINGRLSDRSFRGYWRARFLASKALMQIDLVAAQDEVTADRFRRLGAPRDCVHSTGSLKFDGAQFDRGNPRTQLLRRLAGFTDEDIVFLAGSTQAPEEEYALEIFQRLAKTHTDLRLILVPRHPERFNEVAALLNRSGVDWRRRSALPPAGGVLGAVDCAAPTVDSTLTKHCAGGPTTTESRVLLVDTIGELGAWWGAAHIGFVGGSFGKRGGQNMIEPAAFGVATCFGPNTWNFRDIVAQLLAGETVRVVNNFDELETFVRTAVDDRPWADALGQRARRLVLSQQGAASRTADLLCDLMRLPSASSQRQQRLGAA